MIAAYSCVLALCSGAKSPKCRSMLLFRMTPKKTPSIRVISLLFDLVCHSDGFNIVFPNCTLFWWSCTFSIEMFLLISLQVTICKEATAWNKMAYYSHDKCHILRKNMLNLLFASSCIASCSRNTNKGVFLTNLVLALPKTITIHCYMFLKNRYGHSPLATSFMSRRLIGPD
jgi:hypothetical protein